VPDSRLRFSAVRERRTREALDVFALEGRQSAVARSKIVPGPHVSDVVLHARRRPAQGPRDDAITEAQHVEAEKEPFAVLTRR